MADHLPYKERCKVHYMPPGPEREADRSRTYQGVADAMADQWGPHVERILWSERRAIA